MAETFDLHYGSDKMEGQKDDLKFELISDDLVRVTHTVIKSRLLEDMKKAHAEILAHSNNIIKLNEALDQTRSSQPGKPHTFDEWLRCANYQDSIRRQNDIQSKIAESGKKIDLLKKELAAIPFDTPSSDAVVEIK